MAGLVIGTCFIRRNIVNNGEPLYLKKNTEVIILSKPSYREDD